MAAGTLIIGGGQAGLQVAASLRQGGYGEPIRLVGEEPHPPYQRPPLSKAVLSGEAGLGTVSLRAPAFYADNAIELVTGCRIEAIDPAAQVAITAGARLPYDHLVLATGARVRTLPVPGADLAGVLYLRGLDDALALKAALTPARTVVVIGGGYIGLEVAASATKLGCRVTVVEALPRVLARSVAPVMAEAMVRRHAEKGVAIRCGEKIARLAEQGGRVASVVLADGTSLAADIVVVGIGVVPNEELARAVGLACADGIVTDAFMRTGDPRILAIGDVARSPSQFAAGPVRLESVQNAIDQGKTAAATILGRKEPYAAVPWFWSDQFDMKLQTAGLAMGADAIVVRGEPASGAFSVFSLRAGRIIAVDSLNRPADHMAGRRLVGAAAHLAPADLADPGFDLKRVAQEPARQSA